MLQTSALPLGYVAKSKWSGRRDSNSRPSPWQGDALPLSHSRKWCPEAESNHRHEDFQSSALPTELSGHIIFNFFKLLYFLTYLLYQFSDNSFSRALHYTKILTQNIFDFISIFWLLSYTDSRYLGIIFNFFEFLAFFLLLLFQF